MAGLLNVEGASAADLPACDGWLVGAVPFCSAAAKFWPSLMEEARITIPGCTAIELSATGHARLDRSYLFPDLHMQQDMDRLLADPDCRLEDVLAEMAVLGPPAHVRVSILRGGMVAHDQELPADSLDADTFPYLLVWLLEWGGIAESMWNEAEVRGGFAAVDRQRQREYGVEFAMRRAALSEGLFRQTVRVGPFSITATR